ncbi:ABC transporter ATP-binding protein [Maridesulfovibrio hydrothermalis]|uniref:Oligopeptide ABC transporter (ATP-binding protein) n=1 Tax=Maridesulfovibrio hydrothermalis AM13 = DSM 14728 TaxID=1121451 RepID=L0RBU9_9BACT|nr:dipeptide ABC transporter ATP-binding protein [Maridesulfovibrio hydrothermalis]CCO24263.1 oligopeptide ABC transporter (ATP-binding protein) [Maridesulfovibrio hydrothermalis AM13 = DSM 14728]
MEKNILKLKDIKKSYPVSSGILSLSKATVKAVNGVSFEVIRGETLGLVGESGCGKSTLARLLTGLESPDSGTLLFRDKEYKDWSTSQRGTMIQMVFQDPYSSLNPRQRIGSIISEGMRINKTGSTKEITKRVEELLIQVGLRPEYSKRYPHEFSGGQRQRVAIARAIAMNPDLIVCDEPVSALDVSVQAQVLNLLKNIQKEFSLSYVFISHDLSVVSHISDRVAVMYLGKIMEIAKTEDLYKNPLHPYTRILLDAVPIPDPTLQRENINIPEDMPNPISPPSGCPFNPRCPKAIDICSSSKPELVETESGHSVYCHLY